MQHYPSRQGLTALVNAAARVAPTAVCGFVRPIDADRVAVLYAHGNGIGEYVVPHAELPPPLRPSSDALVEADRAAYSVNPAGVAEWLLQLMAAERLVVAPVAAADPAASFWIGLSRPDPLSDAERRGFVDLAQTTADLLRAPLPPEVAHDQLRRLERTADLLPALQQALDVRQIFDRLSSIANASLPHDHLLLRLFNDDATEVTIYAQSHGKLDPEQMAANPYPPAPTRAWGFAIIDDLTRHAVEASQPLVRTGARSTIRVPVRQHDRLIGGLAFLSREPARYDTADAAIARRLAGYVAVALSHHRLAEEARRAAAINAREASLETLDGLLHTLTGVLDVRDVFDRVSAIAAQVLPHDALSIAEVIDGGERVRIHASHGLGLSPEPFEIATPELWMAREAWDYRLIDDAKARPEYAHGPGVGAGMRAMMFLSINLEDRHFGGLNFYSKTPGRFTKDDVLIARRITNHVALALSHKRLADRLRQADELRAKAEKYDLLDDVLAAVLKSGELREVFDQVSDVTQRVLPHDGLVLAVRVPGDDRHVRLYAAKTPPQAGFPDLIGVAPIVRANPKWEFEVVDDLQTQQDQRGLVAAQQGYRGVLRIPLRIDNAFAAGLSFLSFTAAQYSPADVPIARRIGDRIALVLARERGAMLLRQADEASQRVSALEARVQALTDELDSRTGYRRVVGKSAEWRQVLTQATQVAATETTVLLLGESGSGKEVVARFIHRASPRNGGPFIALNCAALPEQLLEAELFGYERGAFTGAMQSKPGQLELAAGGTLFLDEVGEMSPSAQAKFLRVLQEREFQRLGGTRLLRADTRVVAATNRDLLKAIANNQFREDLYYRLNVFAIGLPALRDRRDDILPLSEAFLNDIGRGLGRPPGGISREARQRLVEYHWPGNVRELRNILERAAILCDGGLITTEHLAFSVAATAPPPKPAPPPEPFVVPAASAPPGAPVAAEPPLAAAGDLNAMERSMIEQALQSARFNKSKAAKSLGLTRHQLYVRMRKHGFD
jgi:transcriptional regulator with GAF, ATPase, and Fis domain